MLFLKNLQFSRESTCVGVSFYKSCRLTKTPTQVFSCKYFEEHLRTAASVSYKISSSQMLNLYMASVIERVTMFVDRRKCQFDSSKPVKGCIYIFF